MCLEEEMDRFLETDHVGQMKELAKADDIDGMLSLMAKVTDEVTNLIKKCDSK